MNNNNINTCSQVTDRPCSPATVTYTAVQLSISMTVTAAAPAPDSIFHCIVDYKENTTNVPGVESVVVKYQFRRKFLYINKPLGKPLFREMV